MAQQVGGAPRPASIADALALLNRAEFRVAWDAHHAAAIQLRGAPDRGSRTRELIETFRRQWGVPPPDDIELYRPGTTRVAEMLAGRWAVIPIFRDTSRADVGRAWQRFDRQLGADVPRWQRKSARAWHQHALASWLKACGFTYAEIARDHYRLLPPTPSARERARVWRREAALLPPTRQATSRAIQTVRDHL